MSIKCVNTRKEFYHVYAQICGSAETSVDQQTAYTILSCCGKTVIQSHFFTEWPPNADVVSADRLFEIFKRLDDLCIDAEELGKIGLRDLTVEDIMESILDSDIMKREAVENCLLGYTRMDGSIDLEKFVEATQQAKLQISSKFLGSPDFSPISDEESYYEQTAEEGTISEIYPERMTSPAREEVVLHGEPRPLATKARGNLSISPTLQSIAFKIKVAQPTECEVILSLASNSDVPVGHFDNDLFLLLHDAEGKVAGLTQFLLENGKYSTGSITVTNNTMVMVIGMGTSFNRRKSTRDRIVLVDEHMKLTKRFKLTLMNIFDAFDVDQNGILDMEEMNFYTLASGDAALKNEDFQLYLDNFDNINRGLTMKGFLEMHQTEAEDSNGNVIADLWSSLNSLGYDSELQSIYGCSYDVAVYSTSEVKLSPQFHFVARSDRIFILEKLYELGEEQNNTQLKYRIFRTDYYGLLIAKKDEQQSNKRYRLEIVEAKGIRWNFPHRKDEEIYLEDSDSDWVLLASFTTKSKDYSLNVSFVEV